MIWPPRSQMIWGFLGATAAAWFAIWMLFFPQYVPEFFAWNVVPRYAQAFIGAGYIFRTLFFLNVARESNWTKLRWIVWGNLAFTGTLLLATFWHIDEFNWSQFTPPTAHIWVVLYIFEPVVMIYLIPRGALRAEGPTTGGADPARVQVVPRPRDRLAADGRTAAHRQPRLRHEAVGVGAEPPRFADRRRVVDGLGVLVRHDGLRPRLGRDPGAGSPLHRQRRRSARDDACSSTVT